MRSPLAGAVVANLSPALADELSLDPFGSGVIVLRVRPDSIARRLGFRPGDIVRGVNGGAVSRVPELLEALKQPVQDWRIEIERDGQRVALQVRG
ncbi:MAG: PDZ domain-containing protein [Acetobacterales bacterium]